MTANTLDDIALDQLFRTARTQNSWSDKPVTAEQLHTLYDLMKFGPTSANCSPARILFVVSDEEKNRLIPMLMEGNQKKARAAPVCAIIGFDTEFYHRLPDLFPHNLEAKNWFNWSAEFATETALRNASLQGGYFIMAARALGLDCGPLSGFDAGKVNEAYFPDGITKVNFLCALGYGDNKDLFDRAPRLPFDQACKIL